MAEIGSDNVLFMGLGASSPCWYRCALPALTLHSDWVGFQGSPDNLKVITGQVGGKATLSEPNYDKYKVIVVQQPWGKEWLRWIYHRQQEGIKILYELDDDIHSVSKSSGHPNQREFRRRIKGYEACLKAADGIVCSTKPLSNRYSRFNNNIFICDQGIDFERYQVNREKDSNTITIGWSGGIGQEEAWGQWIWGLRSFLSKDYDCRFMSVGKDMAAPFGGVHIPYTQVEQYPGVLANFDIALAPAGKSAFFKGKSQLRWIEASALGIPVIASPEPYVDILPGETGVIAENADELEAVLMWLVESPNAREKIGEQARLYIEKHFHIYDKIENWIIAFEEIVER